MGVRGGALGRGARRRALNRTAALPRPKIRARRSPSAGSAIAEVEADASLRFEVKHPKLTGADTYRLSDRDGGTFVEYHSDFTYTGLNKLSTPIGALAVKALARGMDEDLRERLENG